MSLFHVERRNIFQVTFSKFELENLSEESKLDILKECISSYKVEKNIMNENNYECELLIGSSLYDFQCRFIELDDTYYKIETYTISKKSDMFACLDIVKTDANISEEELGSSCTTVNEEVDDKLPSTIEEKSIIEKDVSELQNLISKLHIDITFKENAISKIDKDIFTIHSYDEFKVDTEKQYPYIYQKDDLYFLCTKEGKSFNCKTETAIKLLACFNDDMKIVQNILACDQYDEQFINEYAMFIYKSGSAKGLKVFKHISDSSILNKTKELMKENDFLRGAKNDNGKK